MASKKINIITIDGLAGSGKSTAARKLAMRLGYIHLNSGALFRTLGLRARELNIPLDDEKQVGDLAQRLNFEFKLREDGTTSFTTDGTDDSGKLLSEDVGRLASKVAVLPSVRDCLMRVQQAVAANFSVVVEGRDSGTAVFPEAKKKFFLQASPEVRALRRLGELKQDCPNIQDEKSAFDYILEQVKARDLNDSTRELAPAKSAEDAILVDTSELTPDEVVEKLVSML